jgi:drug/metabolite transporter (DMT)-like permease
MWQLLLGISIISCSIATILQRLLLKNTKHDPVTISIIFQLLTACCIGIYAFITGFSIPNLLPLWPNIVYLTVLYALFNVTMFKALALIEASEFTVLFVTRGLWVIVWSVLLLGEKFSLQQIIGTVLVVCAVVICTLQKSSIKLTKGSWFALASAFIFGIAFVNDAFVVKHFVSAPTYSFIDWLLPGLALCIAYPKAVKQIPALLTPSMFVKLFVLSALYAIFGITILLAYKAGSAASQIGAISQISTILIVMLAVVFLRERTGLLKKLIAALVGFIGIVLIS